jgi:hypothetical protein
MVLDGAELDERSAKLCAAALSMPPVSTHTVITGLL